MPAKRVEAAILHPLPEWGEGILTDTQRPSMRRARDERQDVLAHDLAGLRHGADGEFPDRDEGGLGLACTLLARDLRDPTLASGHFRWISDQIVQVVPHLPAHLLVGQGGPLAVVEGGRRYTVA
jgi:hypothetical protein